MKLIWKYGEEAICPNCGSGNACIGGPTNAYKCRDCHVTFAVVGQYKQVGTDPILGRKIVEAECVVVNPNPQPGA